MTVFNKITCYNKPDNVKKNFHFYNTYLFNYKICYHTFIMFLVYIQILPEISVFNTGKIASF